MVRLSWVFLLVLGAAIGAHATLGNENKPTHNRKDDINDDVNTARADFMHIGDQLLAENAKLIRLIEAFEDIKAQFKALGAGAGAESATQIVQERKALMKRINELVARIRKQEAIVDRLELAHEAQARRVRALETAK